MTDARVRAPIWAVAGLLVVAASCAGSSSAEPTSRLTAGAGAMPPDVARGCELAAVRCTRCHQVDRILNARIRDPEHWRRYVDRMRRMPASGISSRAADSIVRCLVFRSFGAAGLESLSDPPRRQSP